MVAPPRVPPGPRPQGAPRDFSPDTKAQALRFIAHQMVAPIDGTSFACRSGAKRYVVDLTFGSDGTPQARCGCGKRLAPAAANAPGLVSRCRHAAAAVALAGATAACGPPPRAPAAQRAAWEEQRRPPPGAAAPAPSAGPVPRASSSPRRRRRRGGDGASVSSENSAARVGHGAAAAAAQAARAVRAKAARVRSHTAVQQPPSAQPRQRFSGSGRQRRGAGGGAGEGPVSFDEPPPGVPGGLGAKASFRCA
eukprot:TRINITY_DN10027_c1_g1_i1.p2 TRINITY_DN10027_c1_g1~~TRINITY_DN10027_c1_g1_i1.p2  ORF type:complete len:251 (+),score=53.52 TRINITY_DN10027_c1_g1_i1:85-837(+)